MTTAGGRLKLTRARAFVLVAAVSVIALLGEAFFIQRERQKKLQASFSNLASIGKVKAEAIAAWRAERIGDVGEMVESPLFQRAVAALLDTPAAPGSRKEMEERLDVARRFDKGQAVFLTTPDGRILASAGLPPALDSTSLAEIKQAAKDDRSFLGDLFRPEGAGAAVIDAVAPITDGKATAVLVLRSDASRYLYPMVQSWPVPCKSAETLLVERRGDEALFLNDLRFKPGAALVLRQPLSLTTLPAVQAVLGHKGRFEGLDYRGVSVMADLRPIENSPWFLVAKMDRAEILSGFGREMAETLLGVLGLILLFGFGMGFLYEMQRKRAEEKIVQLSRFYRTLSEVNQIVVRIQDRKELLSAACEMLVEHGGFKMAWIGFMDEAAGRVVPEASAGFEEGYLENLVIRWDDSPDGQGPIGRAIREKRPVISRDCLEDPAYVPWRDSALARGYRTICALPIRQGDKVTGAFMVYHADAGAIGEEEAHLLEELANDLSFALDAIKDKAERALAEAALKANEERYRDIVENASDLIFTHDLNGVLLSVNAAIWRALGFAANEFVGRNLSGFLPREQREAFDAYLQAIKLNKEAAGIMKIVNRAGEVRYWEYRNSLRTEGVPQPIVRSMARDVTDAVLARRALKASEEKYRAILESMQEAYYEVDLAGNLTFFNDAGCRLLGYPREELTGMNNRQYTDEENANKLYQAFNRVYRTGEPSREFGWELISKDGSKRTIESSLSLRKDSSGKPLGFSGIIRDVTEEKRAQEALRKSEEKYREMVESINDVIYAADEKGVFSYVSPAISRLTDWAPSDLVGHSWLEFVHPEDGPLVAERMSLVLKGELSLAEYRFLTKKGQVRWCSTSSRPVYDKGRAVGLRGVMRDITEQRRAEDAFRSFFENNPAASYVHAGSGQLLECNQAFCDLFGFESKKQALQANLAERYARPEDRTKFIEELSREKRIALREMTYKRVDGTLVHVYETVMGVFDQDDKLNGAIGFLMDVTERKALEEQLRQSQKMEEVGQLAAGVAHDFNNVLMAIQGASELLGKAIPKDQPGHKDIVTIQKAAERAALITRQLLSFARKTVLDLAPHDPNGIIEGLLPMLKRLLPETIKVEFIQAQDAGFVNVDKGQMEQVLVNLCVNSKDAMHKGGKLTLETENVLVNGAYIETHPWAKPGRYVLISVTDTGTGMKPELLSKIFDPFFTTKAQGKGTGLGLSMAYGIVKQHEGMINVYSELGVGTTFKIYLPMVERRAVEVGTKVERAVTGGHETILVVEDDKEVRNVVVEVLMSLGYKVLVAGDGAEGLAVLRRTEGVSLVITDIVMPKMGGKDLRAATRQIYPALRFIFTSGYTQNVVHHDFVLEKGVAFLSKPYGIDTLARKVREVLDGKDTVGG